MTYQSVCISSGHGKYVRGASGVLDEVDEARLVVEKLAGDLIARGVKVKTYHDDVSKTQSENLNRIVNWHNAQGKHDLDISVHLNAHHETHDPMGTEVLYVTQEALARELSAAIASVGFKDRGPKYRDNLAFLNGTAAPAVLLEICFVDSTADAELYNERFEEICYAIADVVGGPREGEILPPEGPDEELPEGPDEDVLFHAKGKMSYFGGPDDTGVSASEGLAFHYSITAKNQQLFLPNQPGGTSGLARRLNPFVNYVACRWDYNVTPKTVLAESGQRALVRALGSGLEALAFPADWGPNENTGRVADLSPGLCEVLGLETDDECEVIYPYRED